MSDPKHESTSKPSLSSGLYDKLKFIALVLLPAAGSAYFALADIWHWPNPEQVVGSITVIDTVLGGLLHVSSKNNLSNQTTVGKATQYDGQLLAVNHAGDQALTVQLNAPAEELAAKDSVVFKVVQRK